MTTRLSTTGSQSRSPRPEHGQRLSVSDTLSRGGEMPALLLFRSCGNAVGAVREVGDAASHQPGCRAAPGRLHRPRRPRGRFAQSSGAQVSAPRPLSRLQFARSRLAPRASGWLDPGGRPGLRAKRRDAHLWRIGDLSPPPLIRPAFVSARVFVAGLPNRPADAAASRVASTSMRACPRFRQLARRALSTNLRFGPQFVEALISPGRSECVWLAANARPQRAQTQTTRRRRRSARQSRAGPARHRA